MPDSPSPMIKNRKSGSFDIIPLKEEPAMVLKFDPGLVEMSLEKVAEQEIIYK
jgi:hypothetical protein